jgi:hypothetical protein
LGGTGFPFKTLEFELYIRHSLEDPTESETDVEDNFVVRRHNAAFILENP